MVGVLCGDVGAQEVSQGGDPLVEIRKLLSCSKRPEGQGVPCIHGKAQASIRAGAIMQELLFDLLAAHVVCGVLARASPQVNVAADLVLGDAHL